MSDALDLSRLSPALFGDVVEFPDHDADPDVLNEFEDDDGESEFDCGMDIHGNCGKAGSEECDWECPFNRRGLRRN